MNRPLNRRRVEPCCALQPEDHVDIVQVRLIQEKLRAHPEVDVRTVDGFQGQEREVIIVSSVVSDEHVGFLDNANR